MNQEFREHSPANEDQMYIFSEATFNKLIGRVMELIDLNSSYPDENGHLKRMIKRAVREVQHQQSDSIATEVYEQLVDDGLPINQEQ